MIFTSDNWAGAHPKIAKALLETAAQIRPAYGNADEDKALSERFSTLFEAEVAVFPVITGTAANALSLAAAARAGSVFCCHTEAHLRVDECGAPQALSPGTMLEPVWGKLGKIDAGALAQTISTIQAGGLNAGRFSGISITQGTESGTVYSLDEIAHLAELAKQHSAIATPAIHMDGARFANALVRLGCTPAEMTWKAGINILSFGGTKNGCYAAEAIIVFDPQLAQEMTHLRKRSGHHLSKMRLITDQFQAYLDDDLWLENAAHANLMASHLAIGIKNSNKMRLAWQTEINEVFAIAQNDLLASLEEKGARFARWTPPAAEQNLVDGDETMIRLVTSFATANDDVERFLTALS